MSGWEPRGGPPMDRGVSLIEGRANHHCIARRGFYIEILYFILNAYIFNLVVDLVEVVPKGGHGLLAEDVLGQDLLAEVLEQGAALEVPQGEHEHHAGEGCVNSKMRWE